MEVFWKHNSLFILRQVIVLFPQHLCTYNLMQRNDNTLTKYHLILTFLYPWDLFSPDPWISKGWKNTISPFFINKSILFVSLNFSYSFIPKYALFTNPFQSGYSWSKNFPLCDFGIMFKAPFYFVASYKEAQAATILSAGPNGK